jgi:hypothetical protein
MGALNTQRARGIPFSEGAKKGETKQISNKHDSYRRHIFFYDNRTGGK